MTLDHGCKPTIKGHFCSLLVSNIFPNPLFRNLPSSSVITTLKTLLNQILKREQTCFSCNTSHIKGEICLSFSKHSHDTDLQFTLTPSISCVTPPCFLLLKVLLRLYSFTQQTRYFCFQKDTDFKFSWVRTFL